MIVKFDLHFISRNVRASCALIQYPWSASKKPQEGEGGGG